jgi:hypothetical protein
VDETGEEPQEPRKTPIEDVERELQSSMGTVSAPAKLRVKAKKWTLRATGLRLTTQLLLLSAFVLILISMFAWTTFPETSAAIALAPSADTYSAYREMRTEWFGNIKDLIQILVVSLLIPLVASVIASTMSSQRRSKPGE